MIRCLWWAPQVCMRFCEAKRSAAPSVQAALTLSCLLRGKLRESMLIQKAQSCNYRECWFQNIPKHSSFPRGAGVSGWSLLPACVCHGMCVMSTFQTTPNRFLSLLLWHVEKPTGATARQRRGAAATDNGVVWLAVHSSRNLPGFLRKPQPIYEEMYSLGSW